MRASIVKFLSLKIKLSKITIIFRIFIREYSSKLRRKHHFISYSCYSNHLLLRAFNFFLIQILICKVWVYPDQDADPHNIKLKTCIAWRFQLPENSRSSWTLCFLALMANSRACTRHILYALKGMFSKMDDIHFLHFSIGIPLTMESVGKE